jgi:squalene synthase HpnC
VAAAAERTLRDGENANRKLAKSHYENFSIGSLFLPYSQRRDLYNIYAFCRLADDIADEAAGGVSALEQLDEFERNLRLSVEDGSDLPLFKSLGATIRNRNLTLQSFLDLLTAFRQDLTVTRYQTWDELLNYCRYSANPVGRLVLAVFQCSDESYFAYSDKICTALQLTNHWQDVGEDLKRGRIYIPQAVLSQFEVPEAALGRSTPSPEFCRMMLDLGKEADRLFLEGKPLISMVPHGLSAQLYLYWGGGRAALASIRAAGGDVLTSRRRVGKIDRFRLLAGALVRYAGILG